MTSDTVQAAQRLLAEREAVGLKKYGTTVDRTDLKPRQWLRHAIEETSDLLLYLMRLEQTMRLCEGLCGPTMDITDAPDAWTSQPAPAAAHPIQTAPSEHGAEFLAFGRFGYYDSQGSWEKVNRHEDGSLRHQNGLPADEAEYWLPLPQNPCSSSPAAAPEDAERAAYLARWKDAPEWAQWLSQDPDGRCDFFESMPAQDERGVWGLPNDIDFYSGAERLAGYNLLGPYRCEQRPGQGVGE